MAKLPKGILGPISGKIGPVIGGVWKGIPFIKEAKDVPEKLPRTAAQLANEAKFKFVNDWLIPFHPFLTVGFTNMAEGRTEIAAAFKTVYKTVFTGTAPDLLVDHHQMVISSGPLPMVKNPAVTFTGPDLVHFTWNQNAVKGTQYNDQLMVALYDRESGECDGFIGGANRAAQSFTFKVMGETVGRTLDVYLTTFAIGLTKVSNSQYLGQIVPG
ncbi:MAG: DUF6266 family protein [Bacteroidota bacterium]